MESNDSKTGRRTVVIGLDGTPYSFLKKEIEAGNLPSLSNLATSRSLVQMDTETPTISSVAWSSFMTGENPGKHGIFGFTDRKPGTYELYFPNYAHLKAQPLWDRLSAEGKRCCVINVPSTYPARPLNGVLVSGFVAPNLERATYPAAAFEYLSGSGYRIDVDASKGRESLDLLLEDLHETLEKRREAMLHFWKQEPWDFFMTVFTGTDRLHHFLWRHYEQDDSTYGAEFIRYYQRLDEIIGEFVSELPDGCALYMLSDHGFCSIESEVYINALLAERGYLATQGDRVMTIADLDPAGTRAYCLDPGRININLQGREPRGTVAPGDEYEKLCSELTELLLGLEGPSTGRRVVESVTRSRDLYSGAQVEQAADMIAHPYDGYDLKGSMAQQSIFVRGHLTGMHTRDDAFFLADREDVPETKPSIRDLAGIILNRM